MSNHMITHEDLVRIAREVVTGVHRPPDCENPAAYDPPEWVLEAMLRAYQRGDRDGYRRRTELAPLYSEGG